MDKYKRYYGILLFIAVIFILGYISFNIIAPKVEKYRSSCDEIKEKEQLLETKNRQLTIVKNKIKKIKDSIVGSQKKIYFPVESDLGNDTLFFTLYNDIIEMVHSNSVRIKAINYKYNPETDAFVKFGKDVYFVCDINMEVISNYTNLGNLIQDIYQYPYYIRINEIEVSPYPTDKKVLVSKLSLRLYAHTSPKDE